MPNQATAPAAVRVPDALPVLDRVWRLPGVYRPQADTALLAAALHGESLPGSDVLDVGTGSGALALYASRLGARVEAVDVSWRALAAARVNALRAGRRIEVHRRDILRVASRAGGRAYDLVLSNPPYVPAPPGGPATAHRAARAWDAGPDGRQVVDALCTASAGLLRRRGVLLMVHSALCGPQLTVDRLTGLGLSAEIRTRARVPLGPVLRSRLPWLRAGGLLAATDEQEELVVIRAERR
ncbi:HemK2/MTQ2 family protein methyltransferase [Streptomyces sp. NPDC021020]|uniref:HemK2/MTQ2 family protein methyltransferase n=1 Tax=Streptomyces sp. NPDC021020 TaxID=3365109 RepID=UPI00379CCC27